MVFGLGKKKKGKKAEVEKKSTTPKEQIATGNAPSTPTKQSTGVSNSEENELTVAKDSRRRGKRKNIAKSGSKGYNSPLRTIDEEDFPRTQDTVASKSSVLMSVNVMAVGIDDESTEVVMGALTYGNVDSPLAGTKSPTPVRPVVSPEPTPFDEEAEYGGDEDPTILDMKKSVVDEAENKKENFREDQTGPREVRPKSELARKLLDAFNCGEDTTKGVSKPSAIPGLDHAVNNLCGPANIPKRPVYDPEVTADFLKESIKRGLPLLYHQPPPGSEVEESEEEWTGRSVHMTIKLGSYLGTHLLQPRLEWSTLGGGWSRTGSPDITTTSVELLNIHSILGEIEEEREDFGASADDLCFFTITTNEGNVYLFEAATPADRDRIVHGLKSVIARLVYHLISGDPTVSSELYGEERPHASGELPSLRTPTQRLNEISHAFLD